MPVSTSFSVLGSPFFFLEVCKGFAKQTDFAGRLFAMHFPGVFQADSGGSALVQMWFWYGMGYENLLFRIADIFATEGSKFNVLDG